MNDQRIIVVEDQAVVGLDFVGFLKDNGYDNVSCFISAKEAIKNIYLQKPALALLDIKLKDEFSGIEVAKVLQTFKIPYIFISAFSDPKNKIKAEKMEPAGILTKPIQYQALLKTVNTVLNNGTMIELKK